MKSTPFFPAWRARLAPRGSRLARTAQSLRAATLSQLEDRFAAAVPAGLFPKAPAQANSRDRVYTRRRTFWCMLWQCFHPGASGREVVRQLQALFRLHGGPALSPEDGAYCRAKKRLPESEFSQALAATARVADAAAPPLSLLRGRPIKVVDGSTATLPDTPKNRAAYPPLQSPPPNFPLMRLVVLFSLVSGAILTVAQGNLHVAELPLLHLLFASLVRGDIVLGDRGFGNFVLLALLQQQGVDFIGRCARRVDGRCRQKRLGKNDWLVVWQKGPTVSRWLPLAAWMGLPVELTVRVVRGSVVQKGFRVRQVTLVTTLLDPQLYPAAEILQAYVRRWRLEMCLDDLKTTLGMEMLRSRTPAMAHKELWMRLIGHNLIRWVMAQAARAHGVGLERISFKGSLDGLRQFTQAMAQARSKKKRGELWEELLRIVAVDAVPDRPGRREPRAVKRKRNKYPRLSAPRGVFRDRPKRSVRRTKARRNGHGLM
jgi:hypothetical protein